MTLKEIESKVHVSDIQYSLCDDFIDNRPVTSYHVVLECCFTNGPNMLVEFGYVMHRLNHAQARRIAALQIWLQLFASTEEVKNEYLYWKPMLDEMEINISVMSGIGPYTEPNPDDSIEKLFAVDPEETDFTEYKTPRFAGNVRDLAKLFYAIRELKSVVKSGDVGKMIKIGEILYPEHVVMASHIPLLNYLNQRIKDHKQDMMLVDSEEKMG